MIRRIFPPFVGGSGTVGLLAIRLIAGAGMILHGWPKIQHATSWMGPNMHPVLQAAAATAEFGGGICWVLGVLTPLASLLIAATMSVAVCMVHVPNGDPFVATGKDQHGWDLAALYLGAAVMLLLTGPGKLSIDYFLANVALTRTDSGETKR